MAKSLRDKIEKLEKELGRNFTTEELAAIITSVKLGHSRLDVLRYYINRVK